MTRAVVFWSGGKDCAWALHRVRADYDILALITTVDEATGRVPIHDVAGDLIERQAESIGVPLWTVPLPQPCSNIEYHKRLAAIYARACESGASVAVFGDLFLEDIRVFREEALNGSGLAPAFPLWHEPTGALALEMIASGLRAVITAVDPARVSRDLIGRDFDPALIPSGVDPCGENGEFHTFVYDGPMFHHPVCASSL